MEYSEIEIRIKSAIKDFEDKNEDLLEVKANERSLTHKLAECIQKQFPEWNVDCEYNREGFDIKRLNIKPINISSEDDEGTTVYPDIIVHKRKFEENLLVIEAKKVDGEEDRSEYDIKKLRAFLSGLNYKFAIFVEFKVDYRQSVDWRRVE